MIALLWGLGIGCAEHTPCVGEDPQPRALRRLTPTEYERTVSDLLGVDASGRGPDVGDPQVEGFRNDARATTVGQVLADRYRAVGEALAQEADLDPLLRCDPRTTAEVECATSFVHAFGLRAFRRPLSVAEADRYVGLWQEVQQTDGFEQGVRWVIAAMLQSPHLLYRSELGVQDRRGQFVLTDWEMASALSYTLWGTLPDDALLEAAAAGELTRTEDLTSHIDRMAADPRSSRVVVDFVTAWLDLDRVSAVDRDGMSAWHAQSMRDETQERLLTHASGTLRELLVDGELLTDRSLLTVHARASGSSPVHRGLLVRERMLCEEIPEPPANIDLSIGGVDPSATTREQFAQHADNPACAECHQFLDPIGVTFEHYTQLGVYRTEERGHPVDARGELDGVPVHGVAELTTALLDDPRLRTCFSRAGRRFASGMHACGEDVGPDVPLLSTLAELPSTPGFRVRRGDPAEGDTLAIAPVGE